MVCCIHEARSIGIYNHRRFSYTYPGKPTCLQHSERTNPGIQSTRIRRVVHYGSRAGDARRSD